MSRKSECAILFDESCHGYKLPDISSEATAILNTLDINENKSYLINYKIYTDTKCCLRALQMNLKKSIIIEI